LIVAAEVIVAGLLAVVFGALAVQTFFTYR
jgi:hypothetical protein